MPRCAFKKERLAVYRCLRTIRCSLSPQFKNAGWKALANRPSTLLEYLAHITERYVEQRSNWAVGDSLAGIAATTPYEPHANMLKVVTDHCRSTLDNIVWCHRHTFVVNSDDKEGLHWFVCAFDCRVGLERFMVWVWEPLSSICLIGPFLAAPKNHGFTSKH